MNATIRRPKKEGRKITEKHPFAFKLEPATYEKLMRFKAIQAQADRIG